MRADKPLTFRDLAPLPEACSAGHLDDDYELAYLAFVLSQRSGLEAAGQAETALRASLAAPQPFQVDSPGLRMSPVPGGMTPRK